MRVRALKAAPDTAGLYFFMKGFALHPFGEAKQGSSPDKPQFSLPNKFNNITLYKHPFPWYNKALTQKGCDPI